MPHTVSAPHAACVFSIGYQLRSLVEMVNELQNASVTLLLDVRETAWSYKTGFSKGALQRGLAEAGIGYRHAQFVGNPKALRDSAPSHRDCLTMYCDHLGHRPEVLLAFHELMRDLLDRGERVCLLCYERHPDDCHRSVLLRLWQAAHSPSVAVEHLGTEGAPRFIEGRISLAVPFALPSAA